MKNEILAYCCLLGGVLLLNCPSELCGQESIEPKVIEIKKLPEIKPLPPFIRREIARKRKLESSKQLIKEIMKSPTPEGIEYLLRWCETEEVRGKDSSSDFMNDGLTKKDVTARNRILKLVVNYLRTNADQLGVHVALWERINLLKASNFGNQDNGKVLFMRACLLMRRLCGKQSVVQMRDKVEASPLPLDSGVLTIIEETRKKFVPVIRPGRMLVGGPKDEAYKKKNLFWAYFQLHMSLKNSWDEVDGVLLKLLKEDAEATRKYRLYDTREITYGCRKTVDKSDWYDDYLSFASCKANVIYRKALRDGKTFTEAKIEVLTNDDLKVRLVALSTKPLRAEYGTGLFETIVALTKDDIPAVREKSLLAMEYFSFDQRDQVLVEALQDSSSKVRKAAAHTLKISPARLRNNPIAVHTLIVALKDEDPDVRADAATVLGGIGDPQARGPLVSMREDPERDVRRCAEEALQSKIGAPEKLEVYVAKMHEKKASISTIKLLGKFQDQSAIDALVMALLDSDRPLRIRKAVVEALGDNETNAAADALSELIRNSSEKLELRLVAIRSLGYREDPRVLPVLIATLMNNKEDHSLRKKAASALGDIGDRRAVNPLLRALKDTDDNIGSSCIYAFSKIEDPRAVPTLVGILNDKDSSLRFNAARALGFIGDTHAVEPLITAMEDSSVSLDSKRDIVKALGRLKDVRAVPVLIATLENTYDHNYSLNNKERKDLMYLRGDAALALGAIGDIRAMEPLTTAIEDSSEFVRESAAKAFNTIRYHQKTVILKKGL